MIDAHEAELLKDTNVNLIGLPLTTHSAVNPFIIDINDDDKLRATIEKIYKNSKVDKDLRFGLPVDKNDLYREFKNAKIPDLLSFINLLII